MLWTLESIGIMIVAALIAVVIRLEDTPVDDWADKKKVALSILGAVVAVLVAAVYADSQGLVLATYGGLILLAAAGVAGMSTVRAALRDRLP